MSNKRRPSIITPRFGGYRCSGLATSGLHPGLQCCDQHLAGTVADDVIEQRTAGTDFADSSGHVFNLLITNAPGPQRQLYVCGAKLLEAYNGMLHFGVDAGRKATQDVRVVSALLEESLAELPEAAK